MAVLHDLSGNRGHVAFVVETTAARGRYVTTLERVDAPSPTVTVTNRVIHLTDDNGDPTGEVETAEPVATGAVRSRMTATGYRVV